MEASTGIMISKEVTVVNRELGGKKKRLILVSCDKGLIMFQERGKERVWFKSLGYSKEDEKHKLTFMYKRP